MAIIWIKFIWFRIGKGGGLLRTRLWTFSLLSTWAPINVLRNNSKLWRIFVCFVFLFFLIFCSFFRGLFAYLHSCFLAWLTAFCYFFWFLCLLIIMMTVPFLVIMRLVNQLNNQSHQTAAFLRIWSLLRWSRLFPPSIEPRGSLQFSQRHKSGP